MSTTFLTPAQDHEAELLLEAARARTGTKFDRRELVIEGLVAVTLAAVAVAMAVLLPSDRPFALGTSVVLILLYAAARQVGFEIATGYTCPVVLVLVPMLFLLPAQLVPAHVAAGLLVGALGVPVARAPGERESGAGHRLVVALSRSGARLRRRRVR